jgi:hypothetical protein
MIDYHLLLNVLTNISTIVLSVKETCQEIVGEVITRLLEVTGEVETDEWMIEGEQLMMNIQYLITLKTVVIEVKKKNK